jgi:hypothetical protein
MDIKEIQRRIVELSQEDLVKMFYGEERTHFTEKLRRLFQISDDPDCQEEYLALNKELCSLIGIEESTLVFCDKSGNNCNPASNEN